MRKATTADNLRFAPVALTAGTAKQPTACELQNNFVNEILKVLEKFH